MDRSNVSIVGFENPTPNPWNLIIPSSVTYYSSVYSVVDISSNTFQNCSGLASISIPNSVTNIGLSAFNNCSNLINVSLPNNIKILNNTVFFNCISLTSITIPNSVTNIGTSAFQNCDSLTSVTFNGDIPNISTGNFTITGDTAYCNIYAKNQEIIPSFFSKSVFFTYAYQNVIYNFLDSSNVSIVGFSNPIPIPWNLIIPSSITYYSAVYNVVDISSNAFQNCSGLNSIIIPSSVTNIGTSAFQNCDSLTSVTFNGDIPNISSGNFGIQGSTVYYYIYVTNQQNFQGLFTYYVPFPFTDQNVIYNFLDSSNVSIVGFSNPTPNPWNLIISSLITYYSAVYNVVDISSNAFQGCSGLTSIIIPSSVTNIGTSAFQSCPNLTSVTFNGNIPTIGSGNFGIQGSTVYYYIYVTNQQNFQGLFTYYVPFPFTYNNVIYNFLDSSNVSIVGFSNPTPIPWILIIPSSITYNSSLYNVVDISSNAFQNSSSLISVSIDNSVTNIGSNAFNNCSNLANVSLPNNITILNENIFYNCYKLINIIIPYSVTKISSNVFKNCRNLTSIFIPSSVIYIEQQAFFGCISLVSVTFNSNIPTIGSGNFGIRGDTAYYYNGALNTDILSSFFTNVECIDCPQPEKPCVLKCDKNKWDKFKFTSVGNNPNISYKQQMSIKINNTLGGNVHYGGYYLGKPVQVNYLGRTEGQPGGSGAPLRNRF